MDTKNSLLVKCKAQARVRIVFPTTQQMKAMANALTPELFHPAREKARARIATHGRVMVLQFEAKDSTALRAILSSYLRMLAACLNVSNSLLQLEHGHGRWKSAKDGEK